MPNIAIVITKGQAKAYMPTFERGDAATQLFAKDSKTALSFDGVSIAHSESPDPASLRRAIEHLQLRLLRESA